MDATACTTASIVFYLFHLADTARDTKKVDWAVKCLSKMARHAVGVLHESGGGQLHLRDDKVLTLSPRGSCNMKSLNAHRQVTSALSALWEEMGLGSFDDASLLNVTQFAAKCRKHRRASSKHPLSPNSEGTIGDLQMGLVRLLAGCVDSFVRGVITNTPDILTRRIPFRRKSGSGVGPSGAFIGPLQESEQRTRTRALCDVDMIWDLIQEAQETNVSLPLLMRTKKRENYCGASESSVFYWINKFEAMYKARAAMSFDDCKIFNVLTDSSTFSTRETGVSAAYSPENEVGAYMIAQVVKGNSISPGELHLHSSVERLVATRQADRVASYRLLQCLSHQMKILTNAKTTLTKFLVNDGRVNPMDDDDDMMHPLAVALMPLTTNHLRISGNFGSIFVKEKRTSLTD